MYWKICLTVLLVRYSHLYTSILILSLDKPDIITFLIITSCKLNTWVKEQRVGDALFRVALRFTLYALRSTLFTKKWSDILSIPLAKCKQNKCLCTTDTFCILESWQPFWSHCKFHNNVHKNLLIQIENIEVAVAQNISAQFHVTTMENCCVSVSSMADPCLKSRNRVEKRFHPSPVIPWEMVGRWIFIAFFVGSFWWILVTQQRDYQHPE